MSRFKRLIENANTEKPVDDGPVVSLGRFSKKGPINITTSGPYTQSDYLCIKVPCEKEGCDEGILYVVEPEYDLEVGISTSLPLELIFTTLEGSVEEGDIGFWSKHVLATGKLYSFECPECGHENKYAICSDDGLLVLTSTQEHEEVPIPKDRIAYLSNPKSEWTLEE